MVNLYKELSEDYEEVSPMDFYRDIFKPWELDEKDKFTKDKFTGIDDFYAPKIITTFKGRCKWDEDNKKIVLTKRF